MAPAPLEGVQGPMTGYLPSGQEGGPRINTISLGVLIDFTIQRTYHDLTVLAELLPRKTDMERKVEIHKFAVRTRALFIRVIALVKWANSVSKVDKSANIMSFLDKQNMLFIETADMLARMSRETLVRACLPSFHIPAAVEVLTTGTYNRLPTCIREKIVPPDPITSAEKKQTLLRLNQVIQHRLVTGKLLAQMREFKIKNGRVTFEIKHEFNVSLTVMGDGPTVPWRLLDIEILVEDKETGDGKPLVHAQQLNYIHQLIQSRLVDNPNALTEVYTILHFFSQSLQLEVLYTQSLRLSFDRLDDNINVEEYLPGVKITVSYWRELTKKDPKSELGYRLTVQSEPNEIGRPLAVVHVPSLGAKETAEIAERAVRTDHLSMERLIVHTVYIRSVSRLTDLKQEFQAFLKDVDFNLQGTPAILTVPVLTPCLRAEQVHITIDTHTGMLRCHVPKHLDCPIMEEMETSLNGDRSKLQEILSELRYWITHRRCEKTLQHLPATAVEVMPFLSLPDTPLLQAGRHKIFVKLHRHPNIILIVHLKEKPLMPNEMEYTFYVAEVSHFAVEPEEIIDDETNKSKGQQQQQQSTPQQQQQPTQQQQQPAQNQSATTTQTRPTTQTAPTLGNDVPKVFLKLLQLIELDTFAVTHGPGTDVDELPPHKRKASGDLIGPPAKQQKTIYPAYFIPELAHVVALADEKYPFMKLSNALAEAHIRVGSLEVEANETSLVLRVLALPKPTSATQQTEQKQLQLQQQQQQLQQQQQPQTQQQSQQQQQQSGSVSVSTKTKFPVIADHIWKDLIQRIMSISIRTQMSKNNLVRTWVVEFVFYSTLLPSTHQKEQGMRRTVYLTYEQGNHDISKTVEDILKDWSKIVYLYTLIYSFSTLYKLKQSNLSDIVTVKSYSYMNLLLGYGPKKEVTCNIYWSSQSNGFRLNFVGGIGNVNAHSVMRDQLVSHLNRHNDLTKIVKILHDTYAPLSSIAKLPVVPQLGTPRPQVPVLSLLILPQSPCLVRVVYQAMCCIELRFASNKLVHVRDGAFSRFDRNLLDEYTPIQGLKAFLSKYVDENACYRGRSQSEDDTPPSPISGLEDSYGGPGSVTGSTVGAGAGAGAGGSSPFLTSGMRGPQSPRDSGLRFPAPHTPPSSSNPHTPASPHPSAANAPNAPNVQSHPNFNLTSPPAPHMPHPSPSGAGLMPSSPLNPQPSPHGMVHSPGPNTLYMQGHQDSPFTAMSPANTNWPGSPSMPRPSPRPGQSPDHKSGQSAASNSAVVNANASRRSWNGGVRTILTHEALETLCRPSQHPIKDMNAPDMSAIERFLGCVFMRRQLQRSIQTEDTLKPINSTESGVIIFKVDNLQCQVVLNQLHMQSLHMKVSQADATKPFPFTADDLMVIEQFFDLRVACPPYRQVALTAFTRMLSCGPQVLKDFIQIMRLDLKPELGGDQLKWTVQLCMRVPPSATPLVPVGHAGVFICRTKILLFIQITRKLFNGKDWKDSPSIVVPLLYDITSNITQLAERREQQQTPMANLVAILLRRCAEFSIQHGPCSLFPAVRELLVNLQLPDEAPPPNQAALPVVGGPVGVVAPSPNQMMHSPMQQMGVPVGPVQVAPAYAQMAANQQGPQ